jgi:hypothetical protein
MSWLRYARMGDDDHLDGRARFGCACGVASLLVLVYHPIGLFLGPLGVIFSLASLISATIHRPCAPAGSPSPGPRWRLRRSRSRSCWR